MCPALRGAHQPNASVLRPARAGAVVLRTPTSLPVCSTLLWHLQKLSRVLSSCWLAVSWRSIGRPHAHNVLVQALRSRQRPVQVESAAHGLFRLNAIGSGFRSELRSDFGSTSSSA